MDERIYIYALIDPRNGEIRYIGSTNNPEVRHRNHCTGGAKLRIIRKRGASKIPYRDVWIADLRLEGLTPKIWVIELCDKEDRFKREAFWVGYYTNRGFTLTNGNLAGRKARRRLWDSVRTPDWLRGICRNIDFDSVECMDKI